MASTAVGTPGYVSPEIIEGKGYGKETDFWSIGVILYVMLCGFPPFFADDNAELFELIKKAEYDFPEEFWCDISDSAKDLVKKLLVVDRNQRLNAEQVLAHPWM
jgi:calcium/calmodulin-dependent protein kinase I